jgi:hypothetical protein
MDRAGPLERGPETLAAWLTWALTCASIALLAVFVSARQGNLAWDDADYLRRGLTNARLATNGDAALLIPRALDRLLQEQPKPPFLVGWITLCVLIVGRAHLGVLILFSSVVPFLLLLLTVAGLARRSGGAWAGLIAVAGVVASPRTFSFGGKVMVETFLSLWVLLALHLAGRLQSEPGRRLAMGLGLVTGLALLTKTTAVFLLAGAVAWFLWKTTRRAQGRSLRVRALVYAGLSSVAVAGSWYVHNATSAVRFALYSSRFNLVAEGQSQLKPIRDRLVLILADLPGWPLLAVLGILVFVLSAARWLGRDDESRGFAEVQPSTLHFCLVTAASLIGATMVLMIPPHFDTRFLLPLWPAVAVALSGPIARLVASLGFVPRILAGAGLAASVSMSAVGLAREPVAPTHWSATRLIDRLVSRHGVSYLANVGNIETWNVCKTGLINELRSNPDDCCVLQDLSPESQAGLRTRLPRFDAVIVLEPSAFPAGFMEAAPGLNRAAATIHGILAANPGLVRLDDLPVDGLPPMRVYLRRRENSQASPAPARQVSRIGRTLPSAVRRIPPRVQASHEERRS